MQFSFSGRVQTMFEETIRDALQGVTEHSKAATKEHFITGHPGRRGGKYPSAFRALQVSCCRRQS